MAPKAREGVGRSSAWPEAGDPVKRGVKHLLNGGHIHVIRFV
jgi:hypothetical protein